MHAHEHDAAAAAGTDVVGAAHASKRVAHTLVVSLDKDGERLLELTLQPAHDSSEAASVSTMSEWLLLHMLPVTLGLAHALLRLVEAHEVAVAGMATSADAPPPTPHEPAQVAPSSLSCDADARTAGDDNDAVACTDTSVAAATTLSSGSTRALEVVRVCVVRGEVHAYALLMKCCSAAHAVALRHALERSITDAPGVVVAVDHVHEDGRLLTATTSHGSSNNNNNSTTARDEAASASTVALWHVVTASLDSTSQHATWSRRSRRLAPAPTTTTAAAATAVAATSIVACTSTPPPPPPPSSSSSLVALPPRWPPAQLRDELCAICQVEPLASQACVVTLCQHRFHLACYAQLPTTSADCPLCRFSLYELLSDTRCAVCRTCEDLWECLICGLVACGRGRQNHQQAHHDSTGHSCALQSSTHRIWSYRSRSFMHQDVAMLLDCVAESPHSSGSSSSSGGGGTSERAHGNSTTTTTTTTAAVHNAASSSWWHAAEADDDGSGGDDAAMAMRAALTASVEDAVRDYYMAALRTLLAEQQAWYASTSARTTTTNTTTATSTQAAATTITAVPDESAVTAAPAAAHNSNDDDDVRAACEHALSRRMAALVTDEHVGRVRVVHMYVQQTRELCATQQLQLRSLLRQQHAARDELQEQVLLESYANNALRQRISRLQQRLATATARAQHVDAARQREAELQAKVAALLEHYS